jgi:UDP-N-acetyl-D-mannosaminuronic acid dehydrogenase
MVSTAKTAELIKVMEGCYRDVNIALANELFKVSEELGIEFYEARSYANHQFCQIHLPSTGVGGHCIPVYPWFLIKAMEKKERFEKVRLLRTAREQNDGMIDYWAEKIILASLKVNKPLKDVKICLKGITYRQGVKEFYHSRNLALAKELSEKGLKAYAWDELMSKEEVLAMGLNWMDPKDADLVFDCFSLKIDHQ